MIKKLTVILLLAVLALSFSGCSLTEATDADKALGDNMTEETLGANETEITGGTEAVAEPTEAAVEGKLAKVALYFPTEDNSTLKVEERDVRVVGGAILKATVEALIKGPETQGLHNAIPEGTVLNGINIKEKVAIVDFSREFAPAGDAAGVVERQSVVNTLTGITGVEKVRLRIDGVDMTGPDGTLLGDMSPANPDSGGLLPAD